MQHVTTHRFKKEKSARQFSNYSQLLDSCQNKSQPLIYPRYVKSHHTFNRHHSHRTPLFTQSVNPIHSPCSLRLLIQFTLPPIMVMASASSLPAGAAIRRHPPYKQMIVAAIESLNEKDGSNRAAISNFIITNFSDLPPAHDALLTTHIRRLRKHNVLRKVSHSYVLGGDVGVSVPARQCHGRLPVSNGCDPKADPTTHGRRKRGRPSKLSILADAATLNEDVIRGQVVVNDTLQQSPGKRRAGRPKVTEVDDNATFSPISLSSGNVVTKAELGSNPVTAAASVLFEISNRDKSAKVSVFSTPTEDKNAALLNPRLESSGSALAGLKSCVDAIPLSWTTLTEKRKLGRPRKFLPPSPQLGNDSLIMQKPLMDSLREILGKVERVMPCIKRRGCPPKRSKLPGFVSSEAKMNGKEEE